MSSIRERMNRLKKPSGEGQRQDAVDSEEAAGSGHDEGLGTGLAEEDEVGPGSRHGNERKERRASPEKGEWLEEGAAEGASPSWMGGLREEALGEEWEPIGAVFAINEAGRFIRRVRRYRMEEQYGLYRLRELKAESGALSSMTTPPELSARSDRKGGAGQRALLRLQTNRNADCEVNPLQGESVYLNRTDAEDLLFFDTETTGLGLGAGNVPFMIGLGYVQGAEFVVEQLFIRTPPEELAMLTHLQRLLQRFSHVVSYNGRSFDWPILKNRFVLNRLPQPGTNVGQLDFLYPSRSLWKHTLESCRLGRIELDRLGIVRQDDLPGSEAPARYFRFLAEGSPSVLTGVFEHNERDILALAALAIHFAKLLQGKVAMEAMPAEEVFRLGLWLDKAGCAQRSAEAFRHLLSRPDGERLPYLAPLAAHYKKQGRAAEAADLWLLAVEAAQAAGRAPASLAPYIELAMYFEHQRKDYVRALAYAEAAMELAARRLLLTRRDPRQEELAEAVAKRIDRLRKKACRPVKGDGRRDSAAGGRKSRGKQVGDAGGGSGITLF